MVEIKLKHRIARRGRQATARSRGHRGLVPMKGRPLKSARRHRRGSCLPVNQQQCSPRLLVEGFEENERGTQNPTKVNLTLMR